MTNDQRIAHLINEEGFTPSEAAAIVAECHGDTPEEEENER